MSKIPLYTFFTPSHEVMYENWLKPSLPDTVEVKAWKTDQISQTASFYESGWTDTVRLKAQAIAKSIEAQMGGVLIFNDPDIQWFEDCTEDILERLSGNDFVCMDDGMYNTGFFACRCNNKTLQVWGHINQYLKTNNSCDQRVFNQILAKFDVRCQFLPRMEYFNYMHLFGKDTVWNGTDEINIPDDKSDSIKVHHANYTIGVHNKIRMMEIIRDAKTNHIQTDS